MGLLLLLLLIFLIGCFILLVGQKPPTSDELKIARAVKKYPSMRVVGRGGLTMSYEDAAKMYREKVAELKKKGAFKQFEKQEGIMTSDYVREQVGNGNRDFIDRISGRRVTLCAYDFDDGCTGYANVWDAKGEDYEYLDLVDLSCLDPV